ncbi:hypothetical protein ACHWQZ_G014624 [Mnemiopsis leidyi]
MPRGKFRGKTSYGSQFHPKTVSPVQEFRCTTEMSKPAGELNFSTTTRDLPFHTYGRPPIIRPTDNDILNDDFNDEGYSSAGTRASTSLSNKNYVVGGKNDHQTGYEWIARSVESTMKWPNEGRNLTTTNNVMFPKHEVTPYRKGSRNDFVKYVDFGHDTPVHVSVYGADFMKSNIKAPSVVMRKSSTISLERSNTPQETVTSYGAQFTGEKASPLPTLTEMDAHLRSSIELK